MRGAPITVFEITTAAGLLLFARHPADVLLLEVGLGGRLDATNVIERPLATRDHAGLDRPHRFPRRHAGRRSPAEKAGILKRGVPAIVAAQQRDALGVIERQAARLKRRCTIAGEDWTATEERGRLVYQDDDGPARPAAAASSIGRHQFENAGLAIAALRASRRSGLPPAAFEAGIAQRRMAGAHASARRRARLVDLLPAGSELWLDGGHNPDGGRAIAAALADLEERVSRPLVLIVGMLASKDCAGFLRNFTGLARRLIAVPVPGADKSVPAEELAALRARHRAFGHEPRQSRRGARRRAQARPRAAAAHPDHRLALSGRRGAARKRHAAE